MIALGLGGFSAVLGIWVGRDKRRPVVFAGAMSVLISAAILVGGVQSYLDAEGAIQRRADLARMLDMVNEIGAQTGDPAIAELIRAEGGTPMPAAPQPEPELLEAAPEMPVEGSEAPAPTEPAAPTQP